MLRVYPSPSRFDWLDVQVVRVGPLFRSRASRPKVPKPLRSSSRAANRSSSEHFFMASMADDAQPVEQAMAALNIAPYSLEGKLAQTCDLYQDDQVTISKDEKPVIKIHERFEHIYRNQNARAGMANPTDVQSDNSRDKYIIVMDC